MVRRTRILLTAAGLTHVPVGCAEDAERTTARQPPATEQAARQPAGSPSQPSETTAPQESVQLPEGLGERRVVTTKSGAVVLLPKRPSRSMTAPGNGCERREIRQPRGAAEQVLMPPSPGITARRAGAARVVIRYRLSSRDTGCKPAFLRLTIDATGDTLSPAGETIRIRGRTGRVRVRVPSYLGRVDVVRAKTHTRDGRQSATSDVRVR
jgi:hypothetical protein